MAQSQDPPRAKAVDPDSAPTRTPGEAIEDISIAILKLERNVHAGRGDRAGSSLSNAAVIAVCVLAITAVAVHTGFESGGWKVDEITALLLAVLLVAPFIRHLKVLEVGGAKAEFSNNTSDGLSAVVEILKNLNDHLQQLYDAKGLDEAQGLDVGARIPDATPGHVAGSRPLRPLRRILWLTARPEATSYEIDACRKLFDVDVVANVDEAIRNINGELADAVVCSLLYEQGGRWQQDVEGVIDAAKSPSLPVFVYVSHDAPGQGAALVDRGAVIVTADYSQLVRALRAHARVIFDALVRSLLEGIGQLVEQQGDIDYTLQLDDGRLLFVETPHWLHTPKPGSLDTRYHKLAEAISTGHASYGLVVTQKNVLTEFQLAQAPPHVRPLPADNLHDWLNQFLQQRIDPPHVPPSGTNRAGS